MRELVAFVAAGLVDKPEAVEVSSSEADDALLLELRVANEDLGKVIGRQGRTVRALRTLLGAVAPGQRQIRLEIVE
ncbi:MAG TPA: KH domain-containing protein [Desulfurivibrio alkaliphilus]|uniref:RNA-binding protein KhpA n=1 Tax=Desulfurivibrio alkaliphilus TaxID=427923 RepID=A0A7C2TK36_9BACT|nr:KH domain-containing protein [Desulfurivibrio alkaliphilus]